MSTNKKITLHARYGLKHILEQVSENTFRATDFSRFSYTKKDDNGHYEDVTYIDFDGGPFLHVESTAPWDKSRTIKEFILHYEEDKIPYIDIICEKIS